tara:strand:- start:3 stop:428 length:426 start_codon:yes stop_codon:yes gene_type:complete
MKKKTKILVVFSRYNDSRALVKSAWQELDKNKVLYDTLCCEGAFEIPVTIARNIKKYDAFIAIGIIIKGETPNFNLISQSITNGIMDLSILHKKPIGNAILTCLTSTQVKKRIHKGKEAAKAALDVLDPNNNYGVINFDRP